MQCAEGSSDCGDRDCKKVTCTDGYPFQMEMFFEVLLTARKCDLAVCIEADVSLDFSQTEMRMCGSSMYREMF